MSALDELLENNNWRIDESDECSEKDVYIFNGRPPIEDARAQLEALQAEIIANTSGWMDRAIKAEAENAKLRELLKKVHEFHSAVECSYANGNEAQGVDEGEYYGRKAEKEIMDAIAETLKENNK